MEAARSLRKDCFTFTVTLFALGRLHCYIAALAGAMMKDFKEWLVLKRKLSKGSARVYASNVKTMMASAPEEGVTSDFLTEYTTANPSKRTPYRVFREWAEEVHGMMLPALPHRPSGRARKHAAEKEDVNIVEEVPEAVLDAVDALMQGSITAKILSKLMWGHLTYVETKFRYECPTPGDLQTTTVLPESHVEAIKGWAAPFPGKELYTPFIPRRPGSLKQINWSWLELTIAVRRRNQEKC